MAFGNRRLVAARIAARKTQLANGNGYLGYQARGRTRVSTPVRRRIPR